MPSEMEILSAGEWSDVGKQQQEQQQGEVIGTSPNTNEVLVRTPDGNMTWQKTTPDVISKATEVINRNEQIAESNRGIREANKIQGDALNSLDKYKSAGTQNYNIAGYLRDGGDTETLRKAGFDDDSIDKAKKQLTEKPSLEQFTSEYFADRNWKEISIRTAKSKDVAIYDDHLREATKAYIAKFGKGDYALTVAGKTGEFFFQPARVLRPEVQLKDLNAADYAIGAGQVALLFAGPIIGKTAGAAITRLSALGKTANAANKANKAMKAAVSELNKTPIESAKYPEVASKAQTAIQGAKVADNKFIQELNNATEISNREIKQIEKLSSMKGIRNDIKAVNKAQAELDSAWYKTTDVKVNSVKHQKLLNRVEIARTKLDTSLKNLDTRLTPRGKQGVPSGYDAPISSAEYKIGRLEDELKSIEGKIKAEGLESKRADLQGQWVDARNALNNAQLEREALYHARSKGIPAPEVKRYLVKQETRQRIPDLYEQISKWRKPGDLKPVGPAVKGKTQVAVIERTKPKFETKTETRMKLEPEFEKAKVKPSASKVPKIVTDTKVKIAAPGSSGKTSGKQDVRPGSKSADETQLIDAVSHKTVADMKASTSSKAGTKTEENILDKVDSRTDNKTTPIIGIVPGETLETETQTQPKVQAKSQVKVATTTKSDITTKPVKTSRGGILPLRLPKKGGTGSGEGVILLKRGSLAWEQGKLEIKPSKPGPETVYKFAEPPRYKVETSVDKPPSGYHDTGDTPRETIQTIGGPVKRTVSVDMGVTTAHARPDSREITFISKHIKPSIGKRSHSSARGSGLRPAGRYASQHIGRGVFKTKVSKGYLLSRGPLR